MEMIVEDAYIGGFVLKIIVGLCRWLWNLVSKPERPFEFLALILALSDIKRHQELFEVKEAISIRIKYSKDVVAEAFSIPTWEHFLEEV